MRVNTRWLLDYLEPGPTTAQVLDALPRVGLEIEKHHDLSEELRDIRVGFIREKAPLAAAPGMFACRVEVARGETLSIVCASEHEIEVGWGVPIARVGATLPTGTSISAGKFHGVASEGMICLDGEMGLIARGSGLQVFKDEAALGEPITRLNPVDEHLVELNVLPNRPDCLGLIGIAREVAAFLGGGGRLRYPAPLEVPKAPASVPVEVRDSQLCTRYACALIRGVKPAPSPHWLKSRLLTAGLRPHSNLVDVTNFILLEWGQPLHAFDHSKLRGAGIVVRRMEESESLTLLTGKPLPGSGRPLAICDREHPVALAGIMGGLETGTSPTTTDVLIEAAHFDPVAIRITVKRVDLGLAKRGTDASYRFERGTDPNSMLSGALARACELVTSLAGGSLAAVNDVHPTPREPATFRLTPERVSGYLGMPVERHTIRDALRRLEIECSDDLAIRVPTWRADASDPVVLIEDVARQVGYDNIPTRPGAANPTVGVRASLDRLRQRASDHLAAAGFLECRNPPLEDPEAASMGWHDGGNAAVKIQNFANREMSVVRGSLIPGLLQSAARNLRRGAKGVRLFEVDRVFWNEANTPRDAWMVSGLIGGTLRAQDWRNADARADFHEAKGVLETLLDALHAPVQNPHRLYRPCAAVGLRSGTAAEVIVGESRLGRIGEISPELIQAGKNAVRLFAFEVSLCGLLDTSNIQRRVQPMARTPAVTRDLAVVVDQEVSYSQIESLISAGSGDILESTTLIDLYQGPQVAAGRKSLALHLVFRDPARTLAAGEVSSVVDTLVQSLRDRLGAELRA